MFIFVVSTLQKKWNKICMKELASGKCMENDCFLRTLKFEMKSHGYSRGRNRDRSRGDLESHYVGRADGLAGQVWVGGGRHAMGLNKHTL
jgi:hypothetical protein